MNNMKKTGSNPSIHVDGVKVFAYVFMSISALLCILPLVLLVIGSFTDNDTIITSGYSYFPKEWSLAAYKYLMTRSTTILRAYGITVFVTAIGTTVSLVLTLLIAYPLSRRDMPGRMGISFFVFFTMLFNGGLVPLYLLYTNYIGIKNTVWSLIIPRLLLNAYYVILMRTFLQSNVPFELIEAAQIDGAKESTVLLKVIIPLGKPIIATVGLFTGIGYWNDWYNGMIFVTEPNLYSIQNLLTRLLNDLAYIQQAANTADASSVLNTMPSVTVRMAIAVVGILPILVIYPFVQKNFVKGITIGSVKG